MTKSQSNKVFICYAHQDNENSDKRQCWLDRLLEHLYQLKQVDEQFVNIWSDKEIEIGENWHNRIQSAIQNVKVAILLVSPTFLNSEYIRNSELPALLMDAKDKGTFIISIILRKCMFNECEFKYPDPTEGPNKCSLSVFQAANSPDKPLNSIREDEQDKIFYSVAKHVLRVLKSDNISYDSDKPETKNVKSHTDEMNNKLKKNVLNSILIIGGGLIEENLLVESQIEIGYKHSVKRIHYFGGSGVNHSTRLVKTNHSVIPILSIGNDEAGHAIQQSLIDIMRVHPSNSTILEYVNSSDFLCKDITTSRVSILIHKDERTTFTEKIKGVEHFKKFIDERICLLESIPTLQVKAVMIGHIYADDPDIDKHQCITKDIVDKYKNKALIFANFGISQLRRGSEYWKDTLKDISVFQLTIQEAIHLFKDNEQVNSLREMVNWFMKNKITVTITHDKFGAVGLYRDDSRVILAYPIGIDNFVDKTGAGDAFGSGLVSSLMKGRDFDFFEFIRAIEVAREWGAYACTKIGGSNESPDREELRKFKREAKPYPHLSIKDIADPDLKATLELIDRKHGYGNVPYA